jgi:transglutaminase-like putative cysteine protease
VKLHISHRTTYEYDSLVTQSFNECRLKPSSSDVQRCLEYGLSILPHATVSREYQDFYGNFVQYFELPESHTQLVVETNSLVETYLENPFNFETPILWEQLEESLREVDLLYEYLMDSPYIRLTPEIWKFALDLSGTQNDIWTTAINISNGIHNLFKYKPGSTHVNTSASEALAQRAGVCQDYAHVLIGALRSLKIAARYVSGYIYEKIAITDGFKPIHLASHAWCEIYLPNVGWRGLDATNGLIVNDHYVKIAVGRDYSDAAPLKGAYRGSSSQQLKIDVTINSITS